MRKVNFILLFSILFFSNSYSQNSMFDIPFENSGSIAVANPTVTITGSVTEFTISTFTATFTFSENIQNFSLSDVIVTNATTSVFNKISDSKYTALITPTLDGVVTVNIPANSLQNLTNEDNLASNTLSITYDTTKPTVTITSDKTNPTNATSFVVTFTFSEDVSEFKETFFSLRNGNYSNFVSVNKSVYTVTITPTTDGEIIITIPRDKVSDAARNGNSAAQFSTVIDTTKPTTTITSSKTNYSNSAFTTIITFSEDVTGFDINDITLNNATVSNFAATNAKIYSALITPILEGVVTVDVASNAANDAVTNGNTAANQFSIIYDIIKPTVIITADKTNPTNATSFVATFTFSEDIPDFDELYFSVVNGSTNNFTKVSESIYKVTITPLADGTVTINLPENEAQDKAENGNVAAQLSIVVDTVKPTTTITSSVTNQTNSSFTSTITFSKDVTGFDINDITLGNATASNFVATNTKIYSVLITPTLDGIVTVDVANDVANDTANNGNVVAIQFSTTFDGTNPTAIITADEISPTNVISFIATFTFSEDVVDFKESNFSITNGTSSNFSTINQKVYKTTITPLTDGAVTINLPENKTVDTFGNGNTATQFLINADKTNPTTTITSSVTNRTNSAFTSTITFSEDVTGFDINDITLNNATISNFTATNAKVYSALITPITEGVLTINVASNVANDTATNGNTAATQFSTTYDGTKPTKPFVLSIDSYTCARDITTTADNTLVFNGTAEPNSIVEVFLNTVSAGNTTTEANGTWSFDNTSTTLPDTTYSVTATAADLSNNVSDLSASFTIKVSTLDTDGDLIHDFCDDDDDNDGILDAVDNSYLPNPGQEDTDGDGIADVEEDCDNDGIVNYFDKDVVTCQGAIVMKEKYGFSPNGDGINETWIIENIVLYPNNVVSIFNRSGKLVYQMKGYNNSFNGFSNKVNSGKKLPVGAYYFTIAFNTPNSKPAKGWLYINY